MHQISLLIPLAVAALAAAGCGDKKLDQADLEKQGLASLERQVGQKAVGLDCPDDLEAKVGKSTRCTLQADAKTKFGVTITVKSVDGDNAKYDIQVDQTPQR